MYDVLLKSRHTLMTESVLYMLLLSTKLVRYSLMLLYLLRRAIAMYSTLSLRIFYEYSSFTTVFSIRFPERFRGDFLISLFFPFFFHFALVFVLDQPFHLHAMFSRNQRHVNTRLLLPLLPPHHPGCSLLPSSFSLFSFSPPLSFFFLNVSVALINTTFNCLSTHLTSP